MKNRIHRIFLGGVWQYILSFTAIVMVIIIAMGIYLYNYYYKTIYNDFISSNKEYISEISSDHENNMKLINNVALQFAISDTIVPFKLEEQPVKSLALKKQLRQYLVISQFYNDLYLIFNQDKYLYNSATSIHIDHFINKGMVLENTSSETMFDKLYNTTSISVLPEQKGLSAKLESRKMVSYFVPIVPGNIGTLLFVTDASYYDELLGTLEDDKRATYILKDGKIIVSRGTLPLDDTFVIKNLNEMFGKEFFEVNKDGEKFLFVVSRGENGFNYCTIQSMEIFNNKFFSGQWGMLFFILVCTIPAAFLIVLLSRKLQHSMGIIKQLLSRQDDKGNDFDMIQKGIRELLNHNIELSEVAEENTSMRRSEIIRNFIRGTNQTKEYVIEEAKKVGLSLDKRIFCIALMGSRSSGETENAKEILFKLLAQGEKVTGYGAELLSHEQLVCIIFANSSEDMAEMLEGLHNTGKSLFENFVMAVGLEHDDFTQISLAYLEANTAYDNRFLMGNGDILRFCNIESTEQITHIPAMYIGALKNALRSCDGKATDTAISEIFRFLRSGKQSLFTFRILYNEIIHVLINEWNPENIEFQQIYNIFVLSRCLSIQELDDMLREVCNILLNYKKTTLNDSEDTMKKAAIHMRENYVDSNLNMNALAEYLGVSSVSLSVDFKEVMGMSPSDYLTLLRIERAKELLAETNWSIKEVCGAVGYLDVPGFTRRFKKYTGKTPANFRTSYK